MVDHEGQQQQQQQVGSGSAAAATAPPADSTGTTTTNNSAAGVNKEPARIMSVVAPPPSLSAAARGPLIRHLCLFAVVYFICIIVFFFTRDIRTGLIRLQDILTMLNPLLLVPLFYVIALIDPNNNTISTTTTTDQTAMSMPPMGWQTHLVFLLLTVIYVHGDGYHLAANAIHRYEADLATQTVKDVVYFYDEELGHYYTYTGLMGLHIFWMVRQTQWPFAEPFPSRSGRVSLTVFGALHGLVLFITFIEGKFGIPALVFFLVQMVWCIRRRDRLPYDPIIVFTLSYAVMGALLLIIWASWQRGFPELTEAGLI
jgi:hypothetical protein